MKVMKIESVHDFWLLMNMDDALGTDTISAVKYLFLEPKIVFSIYMDPKRPSVHLTNVLYNGHCRT